MGGAIAENWIKYNNFRTVVRNSPATPPRVNATVSPEDQALNKAQQGNDPSFWQRSGDWINDNWGAISAVGMALSFAACVIASFGMCLAVGGAVVGAKLALDTYQYATTGNSMRWGEHVTGLVGVGIGGAFSGLLNGAVRTGMTSRGMRTYISSRRVKSDFWSVNVRINPNGSFDPVGTVWDGTANVTSVALGSEMPGLVAP